MPREAVRRPAALRGNPFRQPRSRTCACTTVSPPWKRLKPAQAGRKSVDLLRCWGSEKRLAGPGWVISRMQPSVVPPAIPSVVFVPPSKQSLAKFHALSSYVSSCLRKQSLLRSPSLAGSPRRHAKFVLTQQKHDTSEALPCEHYFHGCLVQLNTFFRSDDVLLVVNI